MVDIPSSPSSSESTKRRRALRSMSGDTLTEDLGENSSFVIAVPVSCLLCPTLSQCPVSSVQVSSVQVSSVTVSKLSSPSSVSVCCFYIPAVPASHLSAVRPVSADFICLFVRPLACVSCRSRPVCPAFRWSTGVLSFRWSSLTVSQANHPPWSVSSSCIDVSFISRAQLFSSIIPRKFNSDKKKEKDNLSRTRKKNTKTLLAAREAAIAYFARADAVAAEEAAVIEAAAVEVAAIDVATNPADDAAVALVIGIADQHSRPRLPDFVPPLTSRRVLYRLYDRWPSPEEPPTPPGEPESEEKDFIPNLSDCEVRSEVGPSSDDETPEPTSPPPPAPPSPPRRVVQIRNTKTNKTRCVGLDQLFRPESQDKIVLPALTSIDEEEEILSDLKSITDLDLLKRLRTSGKMVHTKVGKKLMKSIAAKEDRDNVRALRAIYVRDFDILEKLHDRHVQCNAPNYSPDDLDGEKQWIQDLYPIVTFIWLRLIRGLPPWSQELHPDIPASRQAKIHEAERKEKEAELMLQQAEDETRRRKKKMQKSEKRKITNERWRRLSGAIMRQQLNDVTVDDQAVPTSASSVVSGLSRVSRVSSHPSIPNNSTFLAQTPAAFTQASTMATTAPITGTMATPRTQPNTVVISTEAQTQAMTTPLVGSVARMPTPTRLFSQPAATVPSTPKGNILGRILKAITPGTLTRSASVPHIPLNITASNVIVTTSTTNPMFSTPSFTRAQPPPSAPPAQPPSAPPAQPPFVPPAQPPSFPPASSASHAWPPNPPLTTSIQVSTVPTSSIPTSATQVTFAPPYSTSHAPVSLGPSYGFVRLQSDCVFGSIWDGFHLRAGHHGRSPASIVIHAVNQLWSRPEVLSKRLGTTIRANQPDVRVRFPWTFRSSTDNPQPARSLYARRLDPWPRCRSRCARPFKHQTTADEGAELRWRPSKLANVFVHDAVSSDAERIAHLHDALTPAIRKDIGGALLNPGLYQHALNELQERYGNPQIVSQACTESILKLRPFMDNDFNALHSFSADLHSVVATLRLGGYGMELYSHATLSQLVAKLPPALKSRWGEKSWAMQPRSRLSKT
ncbi:hypothetical protein DAPPUDRAFT_264814 [Daphnia pulex]|uniref:Uncharacterized protein n=1 Tax=Daphnia pulex TaxID=6669 RepID=E9HSD7_DAPPU|nr:hypothetical protein DAPPUDRAFT_264814 [Daphnia pulex]|eukprot:EFX65353.1 hypothetical protein DAPPUDRAFT_264814 [Daphnia pulex]